MSRRHGGLQQQGAPEGWTYRDEALVETARILNDTVGGRLDSRPRVATSFVTRFSDEIAVATGGYTWSWWGTVGDGSWSVDQTVVAGTGAIGLGLMVGSMVGNNRARNVARREAAMNATPCWRYVDQGQLAVTTHGIYLTGAAGHRSRTWTAVDRADLLSPAVLQMSGMSDDNVANTWLLQSDWAELVFAYWCLTVNTNHPQWLDGSWFPLATMRARAAFFQRDLPTLQPTDGDG